MTDISNDPRTFRFVFGSRRIGAFLERSHNNSSASILVAQVPRFQDCGWWSNKVPVYLVITDTQTDADIHHEQICEFSFEESPSPRKRVREEPMDFVSRLESPIKRPNSQPSHAAGTTSVYSQGPPPIYQSPFGHDSPFPSAQSGSVRPPMHQAIPFSSPSSFETSNVHKHAAESQPRRAATPPSHALSETSQTRYIAEPHDHYSDHSRTPQAFSDMPLSATRSQLSPAFTPGMTPSYYQSSIAASSPATWKSPHPSGNAAGIYVSPPPSSTMSKHEIPFETLSHEEGSDIGGPVLQRTSTISSNPGSTARATTPANAPAGWLPSNKAKLEVLGDLDDMSRNWSADEFGLRRRLVQFWRKQEGNVIKINFRPVGPGTSRPPHAVVISCIYWEERQECFFTSVDAIFLLESLVGNKFAVEEKNRIRRNLEGFRPLTVSKGKIDSESFFKLIMAFPAPKPRNIEKDVKAFPWRILTSALRKIIGKYSASYEGLTERAAGDSAQEVERQTPTPSSAEMPPPSLRRNVTNESSSSIPENQSLQPPQQPQQQQLQLQPEQIPFGSMHLPPPKTLPSLTTSLDRSRTNSPKPPSSAGLSIHVPQPAENLPVLDSTISSTVELERRPSGGPNFPQLSGISNIDFSEFFQSPGNQPGSGSGWPTLNSLFPPPSAGLGPDNGRKH